MSTEALLFALLRHRFPSNLLGKRHGKRQSHAPRFLITILEGAKTRRHKPKTDHTHIANKNAQAHKENPIMV
jgi:hypothetical protein